MNKIFSIYDQKTKSFNQPIFFSTTAQAIRSFGDVVNKEGTVYSKHPEDFVLFEFGLYDESTGLFDIYDTPVATIKAIEVKEDE